MSGLGVGHNIGCQEARFEATLRAQLKDNCGLDWGDHSGDGERYTDVKNAYHVKLTGLGFCMYAKEEERKREESKITFRFLAQVTELMMVPFTKRGNGGIGKSLGEKSRKIMRCHIQLYPRNKIYGPGDSRKGLNWRYVFGSCWHICSNGNLGRRRGCTQKLWGWSQEERQSLEDQC